MRLYMTLMLQYDYFICVGVSDDDAPTVMGLSYSNMRPVNTVQPEKRIRPSNVTCNSPLTIRVGVNHMSRSRILSMLFDYWALWFIFVIAMVPLYVPEFDPLNELLASFPP